MKTRIALLVAILTGLAAIYVNVVIVRNKITSLQSNLREQSASRAKAEVDLATAKKSLEQANDSFQRTTAELKATEEANRNLVTRIETLETRVDESSENLASFQLKYEDTRANLSVYESLMTIQQAATVARQIKGLHQELAALKKENNAMAKMVARQEAELSFAHGNIVFLPAELAGSVQATDPKWRFVVLDAGTDQGVVKHGELLVSRGGRLVGKVIVQRVEKDRSIADVMPGWELSEILEGDTIMPAHPKS